jgi:thiol-disulfide isomerase/thioredoxin
MRPKPVARGNVYWVMLSSSLVVRRVLPVMALVLLAGFSAWRVRSASPDCITGEHASCALPESAAHAASPQGESLGGSAAGPAVIELTSEACPACRRMEPILREARRECAAAGAPVTELDVESVAGGAVASRAGVTSTPTLLFIDAHGNEVERLVGFHPIEQVRGAIEQAYGVACTRLAPSGG